MYSKLTLSAAEFIFNMVWCSDNGISMCSIICCLYVCLFIGVASLSRSVGFEITLNEDDKPPEYTSAAKYPVRITF